MLPVKKSLLPSMVRFFEDDWADLFDWSHRNFSETETTIPSVNIRETKDNYIVEVAAPGLNKEDFEVKLENNVLTIKSERKEEKKEEEEKYTRQEFSYQSFYRSFNLNDRVIDGAKIKAEYHDGILMLELPKKEEAKEIPARKIKVS